MASFGQQKKISSIHSTLNYFLNHYNHFISLFYNLPLKHVLLGSSICAASLILFDFGYGLCSHLQTNASIKKRLSEYNREIYNPYLQRNKNVYSANTIQSNDKPPLFLRNKLRFKDWLFLYFYKTRLNAYINALSRSIRFYLIQKSYRNNANEWMLGRFLTEAPSMLTTIDSTYSEEHNYVLDKLNIQQSEDLIFFSSKGFYIPYHGERQFVEFIEVCCKIYNNNECAAIYWRIKTDKLGHLDKKDLTIEEFMSFVVPWVSLHPHTKLHSYASNIILKNSKYSAKTEELKLIEQDLQTAEASMVALNHVGKTGGIALGWTMDYIANILALNTLDAIWKHGDIINEKLSNFRVPLFLILARNKLKKLFLENKLFGIYNFEATFLCIVCHGLDHYAFKAWENCHLRSNEKMGVDMMLVVTVFTTQNKPIIRESRLKYLAKSKMFKQYSEYLESIDLELSNAVNLINSG